MTKEESYRLNKFIAHCGVCSRRKAGDLVKAGEIKVNGRVEKNPAILVTESDEVFYEGKRISLEKKMVYLLLNKPKNVITSLSDEKGRKTVWDMVKDKSQGMRLYPVGRLDMNTTGLLLITNDGDLTEKLSHPKYEIKKIYEIHLESELDKEDFEKIRSGLELEDGFIKVDKLSYLDSREKLGIEIHSGRNRIIRRIFEHLGYKVKRLDRVYYAGLTKKDLPRGWSRNLHKKEIIMLKHFT